MIRLSAFGFALAGLAALLFVAHLASPWVPPDRPDLLALLRILLGLPVVAFLPGVLLVPSLLGASANRRSDDDRLDPTWLLVGGLGLSIAAHAAHWTLFKVASVPIRATTVLPVVVIEALGLALWLRRGGDRTIAAPTADMGRALSLGALAVLAFALWARPHFITDASWYFFDSRIDDGWEDPAEPHAVRFDRKTRGGWPDRQSFMPSARVLEWKIRNDADAPQSIPVFLLVHGPMGLSARLRARDVDVDEGSLSQLVPVDGLEQPVERYWDYGTISLYASVEVAARDEAAVELHLITPEGIDRDALAPVRVQDWSGIGADHLKERLADAGIHHMHPFQLLNVTENVRWAAEVSTDYVLPGRSPDGLSTLHQPPAWTYLLAPARILLAPEGATAGALLLLVLMGIVAVTLRAVEDDGADVGPILTLVVAANAISHGRMMVHDGSLNFPDPLFAFALLVTAATASSGRVRLFVLWACLAALLRYPGAVVASFAGGMVVLVDPVRRRLARRALERFAFALAAFCAVMLAFGFVSGKLETWLYALYFETIPEHFRNNPEAPPFWSRPLEFGLFWAQVGGVALVLAAPFRGSLARVMAGTALLYAPFLAFIDHMSHHYFLPLIAMAAAAAAANVARDPSIARKRIHLVVLVVAVWGALIWSTSQQI